MGAATISRIETDTQTNYYQEIIDNEQFKGINQPLIINVPEMAEDSSARNLAAHLIGSILSKREFKIEEPSIKRPIESLFEGIQLASQNNEVAKKLVEVNATTDIIERTIKSGFVLKPLPLRITAKGKLLQHDQLMDNVLANSLIRMADHPIMGKRVINETHNTYRIEALNREGYLNEYNFAVFSLAEDLPEAGFFTDTMTCAIQVTSKTEDGLELEPAFVAGKAAPDEKPHDLETIKKLYSLFDIDISNMTPAEIIDTPLLIHKSLMPNGAIDLVKLWDYCANGTFFGENKPIKDYVERLGWCRQKEEEFEPIAKAIAAQLIAEAEHIKTPLQAFQRLNKLSAEKAIDLAIEDKSINPNIFGRPAAEHIVKSREYMNKGQTRLAEQERRLANILENSASCPSMDSMQAAISSSEDAGDGKGSQYFSCQSCGHVNKRPFGGYLSNCQSCKADVSCK